jgi:DNA-binding transcriptional LysR family regulator
MDIDIRLVRHVLTLAQHRNFARAAEKLHLSQPALSRSISRLEETLGVALFDRTPRGAVEQVLDGSVDVGIADLREWGDDSRLQLEPLPQHVGYWFVRTDHPLAGRQGLALADVLAYQLICSPLPRQLVNFFGDFPAAGQADLEKGLFYPAVSLDVISFGPQIAAVSDAVMLSPIGIVAQWLERGELAILDLHLPWQRTAYGFVTRRGRTPAPATLEYMACVRAIEAEALAEEHRLQERYLGPGFAAAVT